MGLLDEIKKAKLKKQNKEESGGFGAVAVLEPSRSHFDTKDDLRHEVNLTSEEIKTRPIDSSACANCYSLEVWLPRAPGIDASDPAAWRCWRCKPPPNASLVAQRRGPSMEAIAGANATEQAIDQPEAFTAVVVSEGSPQCSSCFGSWVIETPTAIGLDRSCYSCRAKITAGQVASDRPTSDGNWRNPFLLFIREAKHGSGEKNSN